MLRLAFDFIITWRETRTRPNAYECVAMIHLIFLIIAHVINLILASCQKSFGEFLRLW